MYRLTHSLLSAWDWATGERAGENAMPDFVSTLKREPHETSKAAQAGIDFENAVTLYAANGHLPEQTLTDAEKRAVIAFGKRLEGATPQVRVEKCVNVAGIDLKLVGIADYVKAGIISDTKRVGMYEYGKYASSTQHPMYFELFPEAMRFDYLIFNGYETYIETYRPGDFEPIEKSIVSFIRDMKEIGLFETYKQYWEVK